MRTAKISVLMPAYNVARFIGDAIRSVLAQSFEEFELIIVNDGSTDDTEAQIQSFSDDRIILINQPNRGIAAALNKGLQAAGTEYIARFDADDICYPHRLETQYRFVTANPTYVIAGSSADYIDEKGNYVFTNYPPAFSDKEIKASQKKSCPFIHSSVIYKKQVVVSLGGYNELAHSFEDHLLWQAITAQGRSFNFHEPLIKVRLNPESITIDEQWRPKAFHQIKKQVIETNFITPEQGKSLQHIIQSQNIKEVKESAYYSLLAKKFLWNNYQPQKARENLSRVIAQNKWHWSSYCFYALSFLPQPILQKGYKLLKPQTSFINSSKHD